MRLLLMLLVACAGCAAPPQAVAESDVLAHLVATGSWMEAARYRRDTVTCAACTEVIRWDFSRQGDAVQVDLTVFQHEPPAGASTAAGAPTCHMRLRLVPEQIDGLDPRLRSVANETTEADECFDNGQVSEQAWQPASGTFAGAELIASWPVKEPKEVFRGWYKDGSVGFPLIACPTSMRIDGRAYCDPGCDVGGSGAQCAYPPVGPLP